MFSVDQKAKNGAHGPIADQIWPSKASKKGEFKPKTLSKDLNFMTFTLLLPFQVGSTHKTQAGKLFPHKRVNGLYIVS